MSPSSSQLFVCGYKLSGARPTAVGASGFLSIASTIDKIYCQDDQIGPFARMEFDGMTVTVQGDGGLQPFPSMTTSWKGQNRVAGSKRAVANTLLIPLYHKIRIPLAMIEPALFELDALLEELRINQDLSHRERIVWDIYLQQQNDFKREILQSASLAGHVKSQIALSHMPRFLWKAQANCNGTPIFDLLFDATDIAQSGCFHSKVIYNAAIEAELANCLANPVVNARLLKTRAASIFKSFIKV